jgi:hypothetical protein
MAVAAQQLDLGIDDRIFAARELITVVHDKYARLVHRLGPGET